MKNTIQAIYTASGKEYPSDDSTLYAIDFLSELIDENHSLDKPEECESDNEFEIKEYQEKNESNYSELFDAIETLADKLESEDDFCFEYDGNEYRIIKDSEIWDIYVEEIKYVVNECYELKLDDIPSWISFEIDWEQAAKNAYVYGYGHTFSTYDGSELEINKHYVFRTN